VVCISLAGLFLVATAAQVWAQEGSASFYGPRFHGHLTANGERFNQYAATCAHRRMKFGSVVRVTNLSNGKSATCRINDRGPYAGGRIIDVSKGIAGRLGMLSSGVVRVSIEVLK
jgi:rare lipoprotein A